jgi:hypothetical protein
VTGSKKGGSVKDLASKLKHPFSGGGALIFFFK